jgi:hypothetical protein
MFSQYWLVALVVAVGIGVTVWLWRPLQARRRQRCFAHARRDFHLQRERLEMKFIHLAEAGSGPHALRWQNCEFDDDVSYVRHRASGEVSAFVGITVMSADPASPLTDIADLIDHLHVGTAIFRFDGTRWETDGKAILNLNPAEAIRHYRNDLEVIDEELAGQA